MGMTLKELLTKGEGTLSAQEAKTLAAQCRMDVETLYTLLEERGIKIIEDEADADVNLDVDSIIAEVENAENNSDELGLGGDENAEAPGKAADRAMVAQQINQALKSLTPREEKVIRLRFGLDDGRPRTLEEVGRDFGVTRERVRQIEAKAIRKLHSRKCLALLNGLIE